MKNLELKYIQDEITALLLAHPEIAEDDVLRENMIEGSTGLHEWLSQIMRLIEFAQIQITGISERIGELHERQDRFERRVLGLRGMILKGMNHADIKHVELAEATLSIRAGVPKVVIVNEQELPIEFMRIKKEPAKDLIKAALTAHEHVPGAALSNSEPVLSIRTK